jgi:ADP-ribose pyrophosphatase YjhB (NUDIX family)
VNNLHLTVAALIERHGRFLVVEELAGGIEVINQPAGHVEFGESLRAAVVREMQEETAWVFDPIAISGVYLWEHPETSERFLRIVFCGSCRDHDKAQALDAGILRTLWLSRQELVARSVQLRSPMVLRAIDDYKSGNRFPVHMFQQIEVEDLASRAAQVI